MAKKKSFSIGSSLTHALEDTVNSANSYSGELNIEVVPLRKIELDPENPRELTLTFNDLHHGLTNKDSQYKKKNYEKNNLQSIAESIKEQGVLNPIIVYKFGDKYRLVTGERRSLASVIAEKEYIPARVLPNKPSPLKLSLLQWIENIEREDLTLWERLRNLEKVASGFTEEKNGEVNELTASSLSQLISCSTQQALNYKNVMMASSKLKLLIKDNQIKNLEKASLISKASLEKQDQLIEACIKGASLKELKALTDRREPFIKQNQQERRGRQAARVNFGITKNINVAKIIINSVLQNEQFKHLESSFSKIKWDDYSAITSAFRELIDVIEKTEKK